MADSLSNQGTLGSANSEVSLSLAGLGGVAIQVQGTFSGTITFEASVQGHDFTAFRVVPVGGTTAVTTTTTTGLWAGSVVGFLVIRARMSSYSSGQATVLLRAVVASPGGGGGGGGTGSDVNLIEVGGAAIALGETTMAASVPVVVASDQTPIPITGSISASNPSVGPTGDPVPVEATFVGVDDGASELIGLGAPEFDGDTGAGTQKVSGLAPLLPASGGSVWGGTPQNPFSIAGNTAKDGSGTRLIPLLDADGHIQADVLSSALPTGAATLAEQQTQTTALGTLLTTTAFNAAFGTAGTADAQVMSVQGIASMTPVQVSQATGTNLHAVIDSGTITTVTTVTTVSTVTAVTAITNALPAGTNNIGDVDVLTVPARQQVLGSAQTVINTAVDIAAGNFSGAPSATFTNNDATVPGAPFAMAMGEFPDWAAAPVAGTVVELWGLLKDVDGTDDDTDAPSGTASGGAMYFGAWVMAAADALQRRTIPIALPGITSGGIGIDFYIKNGTAQNMNNDGGTSCVVKITPYTTKG